MAKDKVPIYDLSFWWLRHGLGITLPLAFVLGGICSILTRHSYTIWAMRFHVTLVAVEGEQAILMGVAYLGIALMLFAHCYAQYDEKMGFYSDRLLAAGALLAGGGILWCSWIFLAH
jgi:hypothetical protein